MNAHFEKATQKELFYIFALFSTDSVGKSEDDIFGNQPKFVSRSIIS